MLSEGAIIFLTRPPKIIELHSGILLRICGLAIRLLLKQLQIHRPAHDLVASIRGMQVIATVGSLGKMRWILRVLRNSVQVDNCVEAATRSEERRVGEEGR